jgi:chromosome segregation ATPase
MATANATSTSNTFSELLTEWNPQPNVAEKFDLLQNEKMRLHNHCAGENTKVNEEAQPLRHEKKQLDELEKADIEKNARLLTEMENRIKNLQKLADERNELALANRDLMKKLDSTQSVLHEQNLELKQCENEITDGNEQQKRLEQEVREIQQRIDDLNQKENERIDEQNLLQLSLNGLQELIAQTQQELAQEQQRLDEEQAELQETERNIEQLKEQLKQMEVQMKRIEMELERLKDEKLQLTMKQNDLKKAQEQLQTIIEQLQTVLKQKEDGLVRMQIEVEKYKEKIDKLKQQLQGIRYLLLHLAKFPTGPKEIPVIF